MTRSIDIFTTPKPFEGLTALHQANALRSWRAIPEVDKIFVFGSVSGDLEVLQEVGATVIEAVAVTGNGLPSIRAMFETAAEKSGSSYLMFSNADMIYLRSFFDEFFRCGEVSQPRFLAVGSRIDFDSEEDFCFGSADAERKFLAHIDSVGKPHPPAGSDYFIFPRDQYEVARLPDLWIGRGGWDLFMIYHANEHGFKTIDLTPSTVGYHQNHDYSLRGPEGPPDYSKDTEAAYNLSLLPEGVAWSEFTLKGCRYSWESSALNQHQEDAPLLETLRPHRRLTLRALLSRVKAWIQRDRHQPLPSKYDQLIDDLQSSEKPGCLRIGTGALQGFLSCDRETFCPANETHWKGLKSVENLKLVFMDGVLQFSTEAEILGSFAFASTHLPEGCRLLITIPDGYHPDSRVVNRMRPYGSAPESRSIKVLLDSEVLGKIASDAGVSMRLLRYHEKGGGFRRNEIGEELIEKTIETVEAGSTVPGEMLVAELTN